MTLTNPLRQETSGQFYLKAPSLEMATQNCQSVWNQHKVKILIGAAVLTTAALAWLNSECVEGFYDDWYCAECIWGKWTPLPCLPNFERYHNLIESCRRGDKIEGCFHGNYYRELTSECKANPTAALCDGNYNHTAWVDSVSHNVKMFKS